MEHQEIATLDAFDEKAGPLSLPDVQQHIQLIQQVLRSVMKPNVHYGVVPGAKKKSLWKPGAELILATFRLGTEPANIEETATGYRATMRVFHVPTGNTVGFGVGSASWAEEKYAWRACRGPDGGIAEYTAAGPANTRLKYLHDGGTIKQIRSNPADYDNTVLKMAIKRARVDACLTVTAASDVFEQDLDPGTDNGQSNGNGNSRSVKETATEVDEAKILKSIEKCANVDELTEVFDQINAIKVAKTKVSLMGAWKARQTELGAGEDAK